MSKRIDITEEQLEEIKALVEYLENDDEEDDYEQYCEENSGGYGHIWQSVVAIRTMIDKIQNHESETNKR